MNITDIWNNVKSNFIVGKDYIETETEDYIVFCPFNYCVLLYFGTMLNEKRSSFNFCHCVAQSLGAYAYWYKRLYQDGRLKTFFIRKDLNLEVPNYKQPPLAEFTGWIDFEDDNFLHFAHLVDNDLATGEYIGFKAEFAYDRHVEEEYKEYVDKMNEVTCEVHDVLFEMYDKYIDKLEETLHNILDGYENS